MGWFLKKAKGAKEKKIVSPELIDDIDPELKFFANNFEGKRSYKYKNIDMVFIIKGNGTDNYGCVWIGANKVFRSKFERKFAGTVLLDMFKAIRNNLDGNREDVENNVRWFKEDVLSDLQRYFVNNKHEYDVCL